MTRGLDAAQLAAASGTHRITVPLVEMALDSGTLRLARSQWNIVHGGNTYIGVSLQIKQLREAAGSIEGAEFMITGLDPVAMTIADQETYKGRIVTVRKAYINANTNAVIGNPTLVFIGRMKAMPAQEVNSACDISLVAEHYDAELSRPAPTRLNDSDHQRFHPGDLGCQYAEKMVEKNIIWPSREALQQ